MEDLKQAVGIIPVLLTLIGLQFASIRWLVNREFKRIEENLSEHEQILYGSKKNPAQNPGLISEVRLISQQQRNMSVDIAEVKSKLESLPDRLIKALDDRHR